MTGVPTPALKPAETDVRIGSVADRAETEADRKAEAATDRLGLGYLRADGAGDTAGGRPAPPAALAAAEGGGERLPPAPRSRMEAGFGRDFSHVRIHDGPAAAAGARAVGADAFALGRDIVFADGAWRPETAPGLALLSHELAHTLSPDPEPVIRRDVGFLEAVARFFGGGSFSEGELLEYLDRLRGDNPTGQPGKDSGKIEGNNDSDNKARAVVEKGLYKAEPVRVRALLIQEMLDGWVSGDDQEMSIRILEEASTGDALEIMEAVGPDRLRKEMEGSRFKRLMDIFTKVYKTDPPPPVELDWQVNLTVSGAADETDGPQGVLIRDLGFKPTGGAMTSLATNTSIVKDSTTIASDVPHPRDKGGEVAIDGAPGIIEGDTVTPGSEGPQQAKTSYPAISHEFDTVEVMVDLHYVRIETGTDRKEHTTTTGAETGTDKSSTTGSSTLDRTGTNTTTGKDKSVSVTKGTSEGVEAGRSVEVQQGGAVRTGKDRTEVDLKHKGSSKSDVDLKEKVDQTSKTTGTNTTTGNITIDLNDVEFEADVKSGIKGKADLSKGEPSITRRLFDLAEPVRKKIIEKVVRRYLGPAAGPASEGIDWILDKLIAQPPDWTVTIDATGKGRVTGSLSGEVTGKWREVQEINQKTRTTGTNTTKGTVKTEGSGTTKGTGTTERTEVERSGSVTQGASEKATVGRKTDVTAGETDVSRTEQINEHETGSSKSDTTTNIDRRNRSESDMEGSDRNRYGAAFDRLDLRVKLTGEKGRYHVMSEAGQRGGGGPVNQQKGTQP
ncbi:eCIS core domain-containing protein [Paracoccus niistensis]|uniref:DUF4157 domain-containing protein n=1 Tax=Paracoccus niistensis TaxID=632935 RepID=A0ABV6I5Q1_9RHOB